MTDLEALQQIIRSLGLQECQRVIEPDRKEYSIQERKNNQVVTLGAGDGYSGFTVEFDFDGEGNIIKHSVWE